MKVFIKILFVVFLMCVSYFYGHYVSPLTEQEYIKEIEIVAVKSCKFMIQETKRECEREKMLKRCK